MQAELPLPTPVPATEKQIHYAASLAAKTKSPLPRGITQDRARLSRWIDAHKPAPSAFNDYPSSKQVGFAERIARLKRTQVPQECFRDRSLMSRWIDSNKPR
ncbi:hypothetical protein DSW25_06020 [Sulfitobacter donghicola DSW-25 = KCTC 12864 = JCM 14565]|uniref:Uncharacterized protein n=1 Tax=Sulfitobacter donghicola DSW-25 = KCTC 12864 = JCM 14565 TaxID=1300350 RepID=A0A073IJR4_9RHOB|nr:hypothetical protein DSW25_06020 [Sulfitobacter donghicola DSW-25 = KCTC 12864 = JCM 14565]